MPINYPNGFTPSNNGGKPKKMQGNNTPFSKTHANRGMSFEECINESNVYYLQRNIAVIHKKPTPIQIVQVDYPRRSAAVIKEAYFSQASTTDYNGVYNGHYIDFEAKETKNKTSFPLKNFHDHQIVHMKQCVQQKGIVFVLLWFSTLNRCFLLGSTALFSAWDNLESGKKSIPLNEIESSGFEIRLGYAPRVPYLEALNEYIKKEIHYD